MGLALGMRLENFPDARGARAAPLQQEQESA